MGSPDPNTYVWVGCLHRNQGLVMLSKTCSSLFLSIANQLLAPPRPHIIFGSPAPNVARHGVDAKQMFVEWQNEWKKQSCWTPTHGLFALQRTSLCKCLNHGTELLSRKASSAAPGHRLTTSPSLATRSGRCGSQVSNSPLLSSSSLFLGLTNSSSSLRNPELLLQVLYRAGVPEWASKFSYYNVFYPNSPSCCWSPWTPKLREGKRWINVMGEFCLSDSTRSPSPLALYQVPPPHCQHWHLSAGGQTFEQTLPIREVTPLGWQARHWEPYGFRAKGLPGRNKGVPPRATPVAGRPPLKISLR